MMSKAKQPPAKARYDLKNPRVSCRLSSEYMNKLNSRTTERGVSYADFIKGVLNGKEQELGYKEGHDDGYSKGHSKGYKDGHTKGHEDGYDDGHTDGFIEGWDEGVENEIQANKDAKKPHFVCGNCNCRFILEKTMISGHSELGRFIECPKCHRENIFLFKDNPNLEKVCRELFQSGKPNVAIDPSGILKGAINLMELPPFQLLSKEGIGGRRLM